MKPSAFAYVLLVLATGMLPARVSADTEADQVLLKIQEAYRSLHTLRADVTMRGTLTPNKKNLQFTGKVALKRPNLWRMEVEGRYDALGDQPRKYLLVSDGKNQWKASLLAGRFLRESVIQKGSGNKEAVYFPYDPLSVLFFDDAWLSSPGWQNRQTRLLPAQKIDGITCSGVEIAVTDIDTARELQLYYRPDGLVRRIRDRRFAAGVQDKVEVDIKNIQTDKDIPNTTFVFVPSPQAVETKQPIVRGYWFLGFIQGE